MDTKDLLLKQYLPRVEFKDYADFYANYKVNIPENFNFAFDIVDGWAAVDENKPALTWCDDRGGEEFLTFGRVAMPSSLKSSTVWLNLKVKALSSSFATSRTTRQATQSHISEDLMFSTTGVRT